MKRKLWIAISTLFILASAGLTVFCGVKWLELKKFNDSYAYIELVENSLLKANEKLSQFNFFGKLFVIMLIVTLSLITITVVIHFIAKAFKNRKKKLKINKKIKKLTERKDLSLTSSPAPALKFCSSCGAEISGAGLFCKSCGQEIQK